MLTGTELVTAWKDLVGDRWTDNARISYSKFTPIPIMAAIDIAKTSAAGITPSDGATCTMYAQVVHGAFLSHGNQAGVERWAEGHIRAELINGHEDHLVNWIYAEGLGIWILDSTFSSNPSLTRWVYQVSDDDEGFSGMMM